MIRLLLLLTLISLTWGSFPGVTRADDQDAVIVYDILGSDGLGGKNPRKIGTVAMQRSTGRYVYRWTIDREVHREARVRAPQGTLFAMAAFDGVRWWSGDYSSREADFLAEIEVYDVSPTSASRPSREWLRRGREDVVFHGQFTSNAPLDGVAKWLGEPDGNPTRLTGLISTVSPQREGIRLHFNTESIDHQRSITGELDENGELDWLEESRSFAGNGPWRPRYLMSGCRFERSVTKLTLDEFEEFVDVRSFLPAALNIVWITGFPRRRVSDSPYRAEVRDAARAVDQYVPDGA